MNILSIEKRAAIVRALVEGNSIRATARLCDTSKATVLKLLVEFGEFCSIYQDHALQNLNAKRVEADEIWAFVGAKAKNATKDGQGEIWTYTALDADSKLMISWLVGARNSENTRAFMRDVAERMGNRIQLTTDGLSWYVRAVEDAFGWNGVDFAQLVKTYGVPMDESERQRRYMRLTNAFSKKAENHAHAFSMHAMFYNFCRPHTMLSKERGGIKTTPAMASDLTNHVWTVEEILEKMNPATLLQSN